MNPNPENRFQSFKELKEELSNCNSILNLL